MRTSLYTILCIAIRLAAVSLALAAVADALTMLAAMGGSAMRGTGVMAGAVAVTLLASFVLWTWPGMLARLAAGRSSGEVFESPIAPEQLQWIALSVLGAWFALEGLVGLCHFGMQRAMFAGMQDLQQDSSELIQTGVYWLIQFAVGIALALGSRGLTGMLRRVRDGSLRGGPEPVQDDGNA